MDDVDRRILATAGAHQVITSAQLEHHLDLPPEVMVRRLARLRAERLVSEEVLGQAGVPVIRVTGSGLEQIGSRLRAPGFDAGDLRSKLVVVWTWVAAWGGAFGEMARVLSAGEAEGLDRAAAESAGAPTGFVVPTAGGLVYPDVAMVSTRGHRIGVHLSLWPHRSVDPGALIRGYEQQSPGPDGVLFLVDTKQMFASVKEVAAGSVLSDRLFVRTANTGRKGPALR